MKHFNRIYRMKILSAKIKNEKGSTQKNEYEI